MLKGCQSEACCNRGCIHLVVMTTICGNVTTSDMSACWANYKNSGDVNNVNRDMRNLWLKIKDWFTGRNSNEIIQALITNRQCLEDYKGHRGEQGEQGEEMRLTASQRAFCAMCETVSQNLINGVTCHISPVHQEGNTQYPGYTKFVLTLPDNTVLGYTLFTDTEAQIIRDILNQPGVDESRGQELLYSTAKLLVQARTLQSTNSETCTTECISSFQLACVRFFQSLSAAKIYVGSSCVYNATECHNGRFGRVTMKFNDTTIVDIGLRCANNDPEFVLSNTVTDDSSQIFYALRNDSRDMPMPDDLSSYFRIQKRSNGQLDLPAAQRNRGRVVLDQYQQKLEYDLLDDNINNTAFVLAHLTLIDRFFPNPTSNINKYSSDFQTHGQIMGIISEIEQDDSNAAEYMAENWVSFTPYGNNSNACVRMGDNGALPTMDNLSPLVQRAVENTRAELANGDIQREKQSHENKLRNVALQRLAELDSTGGLTTKYEHYPIEGVLLEDNTPWVLFDKAGFSELKYISLCLLASRQEN